MQLAHDYPVAAVCAVWGLARSTYYYQPQRPADPALRQALAAVAATWPTYGSRRLTAQLRRAGWTVNRKQVQRLMHELGLAVHAVRQRVRTTNSRHPFGRRRASQRGIGPPRGGWGFPLLVRRGG
jgi:putative transposase